MNKSLKPLGVFAAVVLGGCSMLPQNQPHTYKAADILDALSLKNSQVLVVLPDEETRGRVNISAWEKEGSWWVKKFATMSAVIGRNGFAAPGEKREGDGRTPSGIYALKRAFGYAPSVDTGLDYRQATADDFWVDDPNSPQYNRWVRGTPQAASYEVLRRDDGLYSQAIVIEYNTQRVVPGYGSAIFLHVWRNSDAPTAGCVATSARNVKRLLKWLDASKEPVIILGDEQT
jgi:L,D-peptidoglycan transpeptidase YkuD (ErfK/YbiS/YcfS/YnhG family)